MDFAKKVLAANWPEWEIVGDAEIGKGSYGKVYKIKREYIGNREQFAALKVIRFTDSTDKSHINEMVEEIELMTELKGHTNIVSYEDHKVVEDEEDSGCTILIRMELLTPFSEYIKTNELDNQGIVRLGIDICKALEVCQKKKIIHRDIKPQNIFVSEDGDFKLGDFGSARSLDMTQDVMTIAGSWPYMAPEVVKFEPSGKRADIYSLGTVLYELLNNGCKPHYPSQNPTSKEAEAALQKKLKGEKLSAPCNADGVLSEIVMKACEFDSKKRFSSATEMKKELEKWIPPEEPKEPLLKRIKEKINNVFAKVDRKKLKIVLKTAVCIVLIAAVITGGIFIYNAMPKNNWHEAYQDKLQEMLNKNINFSSVFVGEINADEAPVVAVSTVGIDIYPFPQYVLSYRNGEVKTLFINESGGGTGGTTKEDVLFVKGTDLVVFRYFGNSEGTKGSAQQIIYGIKDGEYVELDNREEFDIKNISDNNLSLSDTQNYLTNQMDDILSQYTGSKDFVYFSEKKVEENPIGYLEEKLDIELSEDIVFKAYWAYEDIVDKVYNSNDAQQNLDTISFAVVDLNGDEMPELIVDNGYKTNTLLNGLEFYSYDDKGLIVIGSQYTAGFELLYDEVLGDGKINAVYLGHETISEHQFDIANNRLIDTSIFEYKEITDSDRDSEGQIILDYPNIIDMYDFENKDAYFDMLYENRTSKNLTGSEARTSIYEEYQEVLQAMLDNGLEFKNTAIHKTGYNYPLVAVSFDKTYSIPDYIIARKRTGETVTFNCTELPCEPYSSIDYDVWFVEEKSAFVYVKAANTSSSFIPENNSIEIYELSSKSDSYELTASYTISHEVPEGESLKDVTTLNEAKEAVRLKMKELIAEKFSGATVYSWSADSHDNHIEYLENGLHIDLVTK